MAKHLRHVDPEELAHLVVDALHVRASSENFRVILSESLPSDAEVPGEFYEDDTGHLYGVATSKNILILWRVKVEKYRLWYFSDLKVVMLPESEATERTVRDLLDEAWRDGAWD